MEEEKDGEMSIKEEGRMMTERERKGWEDALKWWVDGR